jgi:hypothetical protein
MPNEVLKERTHLDLGDDEVDVSGFTPTTRNKDNIPDAEKIEEAAEQSGFVSRNGRRKRRKKPASPFKDQLNLKCREPIKELFEDVGDYLVIHNHTMLERALLALIEKEGTKEQLKAYQEIVK